MQRPLPIRKGVSKPLLIGLPLVLPRGVEHNATKSPIIGEDTTQPGKDTKAGWQEMQE